MTEAASDHVTVFVADKIRTMQRSLPEAEAVAVQDGRILEVGTLDSLQPWLNEFDHTIDDSTFKGKTLMPGFIDPHLHPEMAALILLADIVAPTDWVFPWATYPGVSGRDNYLARVAELVRAKEDPNETFVTWGYHKGWHGDINRHDLDAISSTTPIFVWNRSPHEGVANSAFIERYHISEDLDAQTGQTDIANGLFWEMGAMAALQEWLAEASQNFGAGLARVGAAIQARGITTVADMTTGVFAGTTDNAIAAYRAAYEATDAPFRVVITPAVSGLQKQFPTFEEQFEYLEGLLPTSTDRIRIARRIKLMADGALFGIRMNLQAPCCGSAHNPEWMTTPEELHEQAKFYWKHGYQIHTHVTGDGGVEVMAGITTNAARMLRMENEIGSIAAGKRADFTALDSDPWEVGVEGLKDIVVTHTVFGGQVNLIAS